MEENNLPSPDTTITTSSEPKPQTKDGKSEGINSTSKVGQPKPPKKKNKKKVKSIKPKNTIDSQLINAESSKVPSTSVANSNGYSFFTRLPVVTSRYADYSAFNVITSPARNLVLKAAYNPFFIADRFIEDFKRSTWRLNMAAHLEAGLEYTPRLQIDSPYSRETIHDNIEFQEKWINFNPWADNILHPHVPSVLTYNVTWNTTGYLPNAATDPNWFSATNNSDDITTTALTDETRQLDLWTYRIREVNQPVNTATARQAPNQDIVFDELPFKYDLQTPNLANLSEMKNRNIAFNNFLTSVAITDEKRLNALLLNPQLIFYLVKPYIDVATFLHAFLYSWEEALAVTPDVAKKTGMIPDPVRALNQLNRQQLQTLTGQLTLLKYVLSKIPYDAENYAKAVDFLKGGYDGESLLHEDSTIINPTLSLSVYQPQTPDNTPIQTFRLRPNIGTTALTLQTGNLWSIFPTVHNHHTVGLGVNRALAALSATIPTDFMYILMIDLLNATNWVTRLNQYFVASTPFFMYLDSIGFWSNTKWKFQTPTFNISNNDYPSGSLPNISLSKAINWLEATIPATANDLSPQTHVRFVDNDEDIRHLSIINVTIDKQHSLYDPFNLWISHFNTSHNHKELVSISLYDATFLPYTYAHDYHIGGFSCLRLYSHEHTFSHRANQTIHSTGYNFMFNIFGHAQRTLAYTHSSRYYHPSVAVDTLPDRSYWYSQGWGLLAGVAQNQRAWVAMRFLNRANRLTVSGTYLFNVENHTYFRPDADLITTPYEFVSLRDQLLSVRVTDFVGLTNLEWNIALK